MFRHEFYTRPLTFLALLCLAGCGSALDGSYCSTSRLNEVRFEFDGDDQVIISGPALGSRAGAAMSYLVTDGRVFVGEGTDQQMLEMTQNGALVGGDMTLEPC